MPCYHRQYRGHRREPGQFAFFCMMFLMAVLFALALLTLLAAVAISGPDNYTIWHPPF